MCRNSVPVRKKVLILTPFYPPNIGGVETHCEGLVKEAQKKHEVFVVTIRWGKQKIWKGLPYLKAINIIFRLLLPGFWRCALTDIDVIHAQGFIAGFVGGILKRIFGGKLLITTHALYSFKKGSITARLARRVLDQADVVFTEGEKCRRELSRIGVQGKKVIKYQHWVDLDKFKPGKREHKIMRVLFVGRPIAIKGGHIIKDVEWLWAVRNNPIKVEFKYAENVPIKRMPKVYADASILVVPSLYPESFARVVLEGAAAGCLVIASDRGSLPELVKPAVGFTVKPTVVTFYKRIQFFARNRKVLARRQVDARRYAEKNFSSKNAEVMLNEY